MNGLIEKYLVYKQKNLAEYAETLYKVYEIEDEKLWANLDELKKIVNDLLEIYTKKYYLRDKEELKEFNVNNLNPKDFKMTLALAVIADYYGDKYSEYKNTYKKSIYNLTLIIYIVTNVDKEISFYNYRGVRVKSIISKLNELFNDVIGDAELQKNPFILDMLANKIKDVERKELRFFEALKDTESYLLFTKYDEKLFYSDYQHDINELMSFDDLDVKHVYHKDGFKEMYLPLAYELTTITVLKLYANNCIVPKFMLPITVKFLENSQSYQILKDIFSNPHIKKHIMFSAYFKDYKENHDFFTKIKDMGFDFGLFIDHSEKIIDYSLLKYDYTYYVTEKFIENNPKFGSFTEKGNGKYIILKENKSITEDQLINNFILEEDKNNGVI